MDLAGWLRILNRGSEELDKIVTPFLILPKVDSELVGIAQRKKQLHKPLEYKQLITLSIAVCHNKAGQASWYARFLPSYAFVIGLTCLA